MSNILKSGNAGGKLVDSKSSRQMRLGGLGVSKNRQIATSAKRNNFPSLDEVNKLSYAKSDRPFKKTERISTQLYNLAIDDIISNRLLEDTAFTNMIKNEWYSSESWIPVSDGVMDYFNDTRGWGWLSLCGWRCDTWPDACARCALAIIIVILLIVLI